MSGRKVGSLIVRPRSDYEIDVALRFLRGEATEQQAIDEWGRNCRHHAWQTLRDAVRMGRIVVTRKESI